MDILLDLYDMGLHRKTGSKDGKLLNHVEETLPQSLLMTRELSQLTYRSARYCAPLQ